MILRATSVGYVALPEQATGICRAAALSIAFGPPRGAYILRRRKDFSGLMARCCARVRFGEAF